MVHGDQGTEKEREESSMKLGEIAERLGCQVVGDVDIEISGVAQIENAKEGELSFLSNIKYRKYPRTTLASGDHHG
jgi:UDP-3-O-[3-hydroxymyristoyl] glucosamine N-acyltransferase